MHLFGPLGKYLLDGMLTQPAVSFGDAAIDGCTYVDILMGVFTAVNYLTMKEFTAETAEEALSRLCLAMAKLQAALPAYYLTHVMKQLYHIAQELPCWPTALWSLERLMRWVRERIKNNGKRHRDANVMLNVQKQFGTMRAMLSSDCGRLEEITKAAFGIEEGAPATTDYNRSGKYYSGITVTVASFVYNFSKFNKT
jgi:hypothetical protein